MKEVSKKINQRTATMEEYKNMRMSERLKNDELLELTLFMKLKKNVSLTDYPQLANGHNNKKMLFLQAKNRNTTEKLCMHIIHTVSKNILIWQIEEK